MNSKKRIILISFVLVVLASVGFYHQLSKMEKHSEVESYNFPPNEAFTSAEQLN